MDDMQKMLATAIEELDTELARILIVENDVAPVDVDEEPMLLLIQNSIISNDKPLLQRLLKYNSRLNGQILWSVIDNIEVATLFVCSGTDLSVTQSDTSTTTFLHTLLSNQDDSKIKLAELMIDKGANASAIDECGHTVLQSAIKGGAPVNFIRKIIWNSVADFERNAVAIADSERCAELMPALMSLITANSVNEVTRAKRAGDAIFLLSAQYEACRKEMIKALLHYAVPPHIFNCKVVPVLENTIPISPQVAGKILWHMLDDIEVATRLVRARADLNIRQDDKFQSTFLHVLVASNEPGNLELAELMIDYSADVNALDNRKRSVLQCAIEAKVSKSFIKKLCRNSEAKLKGKVLWNIMWFDNIDLTMMLIQSGADLNVRRDDLLQTSFLHIFAASNEPSKLEFAEMMINNGANVNAVDNEGKSVLQYAIEAGAPKDFIRKLINNSVVNFEENAVAIADSDRCMELLPELISFLTTSSVDEVTRNTMAKDAILLLSSPNPRCHNSHKIMIEAILKLVLPAAVFTAECKCGFNKTILKDTYLGGRALWYMLDDIEMATMLIRSGANLNARHDDSSKMSFLHFLSASNDPNKLKLAELMIDHKANVHVLDSEDRSVLYHAVEGGAPKDFIQKLLWNSVADFARNAVTIADSQRNIELLPELTSLITSSSVDQETKTKRAMDAMFLLSLSNVMYYKSRSVTIETLLKLIVPARVFDLEFDADVQNTFFIYPYLAGKVLWYMLDDIAVATMLVRAGAELDVLRDDKSPITFLHVLVAKNQPSELKLAELMIDRGADVCIIDYNEETVLQCAMRVGAPKYFIHILIQNSIANFGRNVINIADYERVEELMPILVSFLMGSELIDDAEKSARVKDAIYSLIELLNRVIIQSRLQAIEYLLKHAITVDIFDSKTYEILAGLILSRNYELVKLFFQYGADPNINTNQDVPLLCLAAKMEESSIAMLLIKYGADVNRQSKNGVRPIHEACSSSSINNLLLLVRFGADVNVVDNRGNTPLIILLEQNWSEESDLYHIIVRRLALVAFKGTKINCRDMCIIRKIPFLRKLFDSCTDELYRMQEMEIVEGISYSKFLIESIEKTSKYIRRNDLTSIFNDDSVLLKLKRLFPYYDYDFQDTYLLAEERGRLVMEREQFLIEIVSEVYQITLPDVVINKIVNYANFDEQLKNYMLELHSSTFI